VEVGVRTCDLNPGRPDSDSSGVEMTQIVRDTLEGQNPLRVLTTSSGIVGLPLSGGGFQIEP